MINFVVCVLAVYRKYYLRVGIEIDEFVSRIRTNPPVVIKTYL